MADMDRVKYEYDVAVDWRLREFCEKCSFRLNNRWSAQGGVAVTTSLGNTVTYAQAFVREVPREGDE